MRRFIAAIGIVSLAFVGCADIEEDKTTTVTATIAAEDGSEFEVTIETDRSTEVAMGYMSNIVVTPLDPSDADNVQGFQNVGLVPAIDLNIEQIAIDGGFEVTVEPVNVLTEKMDNYRWNLDDLAHAMGFCPPGH